MSSKSLDPAADQELRERELEKREARTIYTLTVDDLLSEMRIREVTLGGVQFVAMVSVDFRRVGKGPIEIESLDISKIYMICLTLGNEFVRLDDESFKDCQSLVFDEFVSQAERLALRYAKDVPDYMWHDYDEN